MKYISGLGQLRMKCGYTFRTINEEQRIQIVVMKCIFKERDLGL